MEDVLEVYLRPRNSKKPLVCLDEASKQLIAETRKSLPVEPGHKKITIYRQCELLSLGRSSLYYKSKGQTEYNERLMKLIDEQYIETPFYGIDKMTRWHLAV